LRQAACLEDVDYRTPRGLDRSLIHSLFRLDRRGLFRWDHSGVFVPMTIGSRALQILGVLVERPGDLVSTYLPRFERIFCLVQNAS
jgi:hypothetical protein